MDQQALIFSILHRISSRVKNVEMSSFIALFSGSPNRSSRIVCIGVRWNLLGQVGGAPGVGALIGRFVENRGWRSKANLNCLYGR